LVRGISLMGVRGTLSSGSVSNLGEDFFLLVDPIISYSILKTHPSQVNRTGKRERIPPDPPY
jgi:hypothetical protein